MKRLAFANQLRGVAALSVAASHLIGVFWLMRDVVSASTLTPVQPGANDPMIWLVVHPWFNFGPFGVAIFFLISGLVIPISLAEHTRPSFLAARALRIYPVYAAAVLIEVAVMMVNGHVWGMPFTHSAWTVISNMLLIQDLVGQPSLDLVNWTLCVELRFYVVMALLAPAIRRGGVPPLFGLAVLACGLNALASHGAFGPAAPDPVLLSYTVSTETLFGCFMLVGVLFNYHLRGLLGLQGLIASVAGMMALFAFCWTVSVLDTQFPGVTANYACGLGVFAALYAVRRWVPANRVLDGLAAISFPFYCVHSLMGYSVLKLLLLVAGLSYPAALPLALACVMLVATGLHLTIERATIRLGKRLRPSRRAAAEPPLPGRKVVAL